MKKQPVGARAAIRAQSTLSGGAYEPLTLSDCAGGSMGMWAASTNWAGVLLPDDAIVAIITVALLSAHLRLVLVESLSNHAKA